MQWFASIVLFVQRLFLGFERLRKGGNEELPTKWQPVFIIGAPRSGSTLLFQLLISNYRLAFVSNIMALFPNRLSFTASITKKEMLEVKEVKESDLGYVAGLHSPNEAGAIMRLWFEKPLTEKQRQQVRQTVARISRSLEGPMIFKNLNNSLRIDHILSVFPEARMIYLNREAMFNAQSILRARRKLGIGQNEWWSVEPDGFEQFLGKKDAEQAAWQVKKINAIVEAAMAAHATQFVKLSYEDMTSAPEDSLKRIEASLGLEPKTSSLQIKSIRAKDKIRVSQEDWDVMKSHLGA